MKTPSASTTRQSPGWLVRLRSHKRDDVCMNYQTTPRSYAAWWVGLLFLHFVNLVYYAGAATLYNSFKLSYTYVAIRLLSIGIHNSEYPQISAIHATIAAVHAAFILLMVGSSISARKLVFQPDFRRILRHLAQHRPLARLFRMCSSNAGSPVADAATSERTLSSRSLARIKDPIVAAGAFVFSREGLLGVDSVYFDHILLLRELLETSLQSYQVYRMSQLLPRLWLIRLYVALLVANCWIVPLLHRFYRDRETTRRMLCLLCDAVLDVVSSIGISLIIFATYAPQYVDPAGVGFPYENWFNDDWLASMQQEFQMMLVASWGDMVSRLVFALGLLQCIESIKEMLTPPAMAKLTVAYSNTVSSTKPHLLISPIVDQSSDSTSVVKSTGGSAEITARTIPSESTEQVRGPHVTTAQVNTLKTSRTRRILHFVVNVVGPGAFVVWGFVILAVQLVAESHHSDTACELRLKPWLSSKPGCSIIEVNCHSLQSNGQDHLMASALETFDPQRAARVTFRHCPSLVLTPKFREFTNMAGLKIYNSTVASWDDSAALTSADHPAVRQVFLVRTFFSNGELPPGLLSNDFPPLVSDVTLCVTNLRVLPDDLDKKWAQGIYIGLEHAEFTSIPDVVLRLQPTLVSVAGSPVTSVPVELFEIPSLQYLLLGYTRIQELPRNVTRVSPVLALVYVDQTNVSTFWSWMDPFIYFQTFVGIKLFTAYGTPYCHELEQIEAGTRSNFSVTTTSDLATVMDVSTPKKLAFTQRVVDCTRGKASHFPLSLEDAIHGLR